MARHAPRLALWLTAVLVGSLLAGLADAQKIIESPYEPAGIAETCKLTACPNGAPGAMGPPGPEGPMGMPNLKPGPTGAHGPHGPKGARGAAGDGHWCARMTTVNATCDYFDRHHGYVLSVTAECEYEDELVVGGACVAYVQNDDRKRPVWPVYGFDLHPIGPHSSQMGLQRWDQQPFGVGDGGARPHRPSFVECWTNVMWPNGTARADIVLEARAYCCAYTVGAPQFDWSGGHHDGNGTDDNGWVDNGGIGSGEFPQAAAGSSSGSGSGAPPSGAPKRKRPIGSRIGVVQTPAHTPPPSTPVPAPVTEVVVEVQPPLPPPPPPAADVLVVGVQPSADTRPPPGAAADAGTPVQPPAQEEEPLQEQPPPPAAATAEQPFEEEQQQPDAFGGEEATPPMALEIWPSPS